MRVWALLLLLAGVAGAGERELAHDSGAKEGHRSCAGTGHVVEFERPRGRWWIRAIAVHGARYGGGYDPAATRFQVAVCDSDLKPLSSTEASYGLFAHGRFEWVEIPLTEPIQAPRRFRVVVSFDPAQTRGVFVGWSGAERSRSGFGLPGGRWEAFDANKEWMIRVRLSSTQPEAPEPRAEPRHPPSVYLEDFDFLARTVRARFPALRKKGVDWRAACREWRPRFKECPDDRTHVLHARRMLALLGDAHSGLTDTAVEAHVPSFDGLFGGGLWIASDRGRLVLRATSPGHPLADRIPRGSLLLRIDGRPAMLVHEEVRDRLRAWSGWSSDHFLDARLSFQFFPFGDKETLALQFLTPDGQRAEVEIGRWGPDGRGCSRIETTLPEGLRANGHAVSKRLEGDLGYLRILGGMNEATRAEFDGALDALQGVRGILLDCRGMGGGGDDPAWAMAGRFFPKRTRQGSAPALGPTGAWQFDGPVVMLQDEREISSAETFTWALVETGRALSVGRPTGGATIIPTTFEAPSGLFSFRMGIHDRKTPIEGVQPEGIGTPPHILVPYEPALFERDPDPARAVGLAALCELVAGSSREKILPDGPGLPVRAPGRELLAASLRWQLLVCESEHNPAPPFAEGRDWLAALGAQARSAGLDDLAEEADAAARRWSREAEAQRAWEAMERPRDGKRLQEFAKKFAGTRYGALAGAGK